jgi:hypothetical protein
LGGDLGGEIRPRRRAGGSLLRGHIRRMPGVIV